MNSERRQHRRQDIRFPLSCLARGEDPSLGLRCLTLNISTGGVAFEADLPQTGELPAAHSLIDIELTVPPGDGHFPYQSSVTSTAEVLRCETIEHTGNGSPRPRLRIAASFREPLKFDLCSASLAM